MPATVIDDLHRLIEALLERDPDGTWGHSKLLVESIECAGRNGLPTRGEVAAVLCQMVAEELRGTLRGRAADV